MTIFPSLVRVGLLGAALAAHAPAQEWTSFREPNGSGVSKATTVPVLWGERLFVTGADEDTGKRTLVCLDAGDSRHVGVCVDTGNSIALLEDPLEVVRTLAPRAFTVHLKDMAVAEYDEGFLLAEVPLGEGFLNLAKMIALLREARPEIHFNLEMITRDPLRVPCLTEPYWATSTDVPGQDLARTLVLVRKHRPKRPLPRLSGKESKEQLAIEEENVRKSLAYAR
jgi:hypothetical protein